MNIDWSARAELLEKVKLHTRIDTTEEDGLIKQYVEAALFHVEQHCDIKLTEGEPVADNEVAMAPDIWQAVYLLVAHWYANREAVALGTIATTLPLGLERLLWYRKRF
jgi:uncharacterized phage protein (predicted DNA packaging)